VTRQVQTILDNGELQLVHSSTSSCSAECQTDFEPMWFFGSIPSVLTANESDESTTQVSSLPISQGLIDMRNCDQFTVARLEDIRDPSAQSFVMVQASGISGSGDADCLLHNSKLIGDQGQTGLQGSSLFPPSLGSTPTMFVGNNMQWKRELELSRPGTVDDAEELSHHPANVDSGIWDMVQAFGSGDGGTSHVDLFNSVSDRSFANEIPSSEIVKDRGINDAELKGTYRMFSTSGTTQSDLVETARCGNININTGNGAVRRRDHGCGLGNALEPIAVVDFVVHRVEADSCLEKLRGPQFSEGSKVNECNQRSVEKEKKIVESRDRRKIVRVDEPIRLDKNELRVSDPDDGTSGKSVQSTDLSSDEDGVISRQFRTDEDRSVPTQPDSGRETMMTESDLKASATSDTAHRDIVEITSVRVARRSTKRRTAGRYKYWRESHLKSRKVKSADTSPRCSSLIDVAVDPLGLVSGVGSLSLAQSSELLNNHSAVGVLDSEPSSRRLYKSENATQHPIVSSPCSPWQNCDRSTRIGSANLSVSSLDWLADGVVPGFDRAPSAPSLDLYAEPDFVDFAKFPNWMRDLPEVLHYVPISDLCIPGK